jgi:hypothetical protein
MALTYKSLDKAVRKAYFKKRWENISIFCDRKSHPIGVGYRRYRRGKRRCNFCGAKIGKIKMQFRNSMAWLFETSPLVLKLLEKVPSSVNGGEHIITTLLYKKEPGRGRSE